jgi:hypothetical protein
MSQLHTEQEPVNKPTRLLAYEARLLRWENYIRRTHHVACGFAILSILVFATFELMPDSNVLIDRETWLLPVMMLLTVYTTRLQIRHIDSIKFHQSRDSQPTD